MSENTPALIIEYLHKNRSASAGELSLAFSMTKSNVQHHLKSLLRSKEIETFPPSHQNQNRRGRPEVRYRISLDKETNNISGLADALLSLLNQISPPTSNTSDTYKILSNLLIPSTQPANQSVRSFNQAILLLNQHHYQARWEAYKSGPRITFRNCPYTQILDSHPELCKIDTVLLTQLTGASITMESRIDFKKPGSMCIFSASIPK